MKLIRIFLAVVLLSLSSCSKRPAGVPASGVVSAVEVSNFMIEAGYGTGYLADPSYSTPEVAFLDWEFGKILLQDYLDCGFQYRPGVFDCDKFALEAVAVIHRLNVKNPEFKSGVAFGECWFRLENGKAHAVNFAIVKGLKIAFYEPQTFEIARLTAFERSNVIFWRL